MLHPISGIFPSRKKQYQKNTKSRLIYRHFLLQYTSLFLSRRNYITPTNKKINILWQLNLPLENEKEIGLNAHVDSSHVSEWCCCCWQWKESTSTHFRLVYNRIFVFLVSFAFPKTKTSFKSSRMDSNWQHISLISNVPSTHTQRKCHCFKYSIFSNIVYTCQNEFTLKRKFTRNCSVLKTAVIFYNLLFTSLLLSNIKMMSLMVDSL